MQEKEKFLEGGVFRGGRQNRSKKGHHQHHLKTFLQARGRPHDSSIRTRLGEKEKQS